REETRDKGASKEEIDKARDEVAKLKKVLMERVEQMRLAEERLRDAAARLGKLEGKNVEKRDIRIIIGGDEGKGWRIIGDDVKGWRIDGDGVKGWRIERSNRLPGVPVVPPIPREKRKPVDPATGRPTPQDEKLDPRPVEPGTRTTPRPADGD